jgi:hypothetical protein
MTRSDHLRRLPALLVLALLGGALLGGCESTDEPTFENPLDPASPGSSDPFGLTAVYANGQVSLEWTVPEGPAIAQIVIESIINSQPADLDTVDVSETVWIDTSPRGNAENLYRLRAENASGGAAQTSHVVAATVFVPPVVTIPDGVVQATTGGVKITEAVQDIVVRAVNGDVVQVDTLLDFSSTEPLALVDGEATYTDFAIRKPRIAGGAVLPQRNLYVRAGLQPDGGAPQWTGVIDSLQVTMELVTSFGRQGGGNLLAEPSVDITLLSGGAGADSVRFATSEDALAEQPWLAATATYEDVPLRDTPLPQELHAQYLSSFGDVVTAQPITLRGDDLANASVSLELPESGLVDGRDVTVLSSAVATEMRLSTSVGFENGTGWIAYADTAIYTFATEDPGPLTLYAQYRNHWYLSPVFSEQLELAAAVLDPTFADPVDGDPVSGGSTIAVSGTVGGLGQGYTLTRVETNLGAGWQDIPVDTLWAAEWTAPTFEADTEWPLGVRATAVDDTTGALIQGVAWIEVVVTQLTLAITDPAEGEEVATGELVTIRGLATQDLTAAPLDSIRVAVADTVITTTESLTGWSVGWDAAAVADTTDATITATVYAGEDSREDRVDVVLLPPEPEEEEDR